MDKVRAFIAVEIGPAHKEKLSSLLTHFKKSNADVKWVSASQMHFTLKFLGNIETAAIEKISGCLEKIASSRSGFALRFSEISAFPDMKRPRVIWVGVDKGSGELKDLFEKIEGALEDLGFQREKREYRAHLTLGRVRSLKNISGLLGLIENTGLIWKDEINIDKIVLFKSSLTPKGAIYTPLSTVGLKPRAR